MARLQELHSLFLVRNADRWVPLCSERTTVRAKGAADCDPPLAEGPCGIQLKDKEMGRRTFHGEGAT